MRVLWWGVLYVLPSLCLAHRWGRVQGGARAGALFFGRARPIGERERACTPASALSRPTLAAPAVEKDATRWLLGSAADGGRQPTPNCERNLPVARIVRFCAPAAPPPPPAHQTRPTLRAMRASKQTRC